jgi:hypothetical protein
MTSSFSSIRVSSISMNLSMDENNHQHKHHQVLVDVYKHFKIIHAQFRLPQIGANNGNAKHLPCLDLGTNNLQDLLGSKP